MWCWDARGRAKLRLPATCFRAAIPPVILALLLGASPPAGALRDEDLPLDHWSVPLLEEARLRGWPLTDTPSFRPYHRPAVAGAVRAGGVEPEGRELLLLRGWLAAECPARAEASGGSAAGAAWLEPAWGTELGDERIEKAVLRLEGAARWLDRFDAYLRLEVDSDGGGDPDFLGQTWKGGTTGVVEYATLACGGETWRAEAGRSRHGWGPVPRGGLMLSGLSPSQDGVTLEATFAGGRLKAQMLALSLDRMRVSRAEMSGLTESSWFPADGTALDVRRFLSAHRLVWRAGERFWIGASETVLYGGPFRGWEPYYLVPFLPFYSEQWNRGNNDNLLVGFDADWYPSPGSRLFGELLIDDAQYDTGREPQEIAWTVGAAQVLRAGGVAPALRVDYTRVNTWTYGQVMPWNRYTMGRAPLGDPLGPDADRWRAELALPLTRRLRLVAEGLRTRRGEVRPETPRPVAVPFGRSFPSGVVERNEGGRITLELLAPPRLRAAAWAGGERTRNRANVQGRDRSRWIGGLELRIGSFLPAPAEDES